MDTNKFDYFPNVCGEVVASAIRQEKWKGKKERKKLSLFSDYKTIYTENKNSSNLPQKNTTGTK